MIKWCNPDALHVNLVEDTKDIVAMENFEQIIEGPTRFWVGQTPSLIDHCWVNRAEKILEIKNVCRSAGDHNFISIRYRIKGVDGKMNDILKKKRTNLDPEEYRSRISLIDWSPMYEMTNIDLVNSYFGEKILEVLDSMAPIIKLQPRNKKNVWLKKETREKIILRDIARENASKSLKEEDWKLYKKLRNKCNFLVKKDRIIHFSDLNNLHIKNKDSSSLFKLANKCMNIKNSGTLTSFLAGGKVILSPKDMANIQMHFFNDKIEKLIKNLPKITLTP